MNPGQGGATPNSHLPDTAARLYGVVLGIGIVCSLAIVTTYEVTLPIIQRNKVEQRRQAILDVIPDARDIAAYQYQHETERFVPADDTEQDELVFAGFSPSGELAGIALLASGTGYQDTIQLLYGYDTKVEEIVGIRILESRETPGLGDRIESDEAFLHNFLHLDVRVTSESDGLEHPIEYVKQGEKSFAWEIDGITGATISSRAVAEMIQKSAAFWIPRVVRRRSDFVVPASGSQQ